MEPIAQQAGPDRIEELPPEAVLVADEGAVDAFMDAYAKSELERRSERIERMIDKARATS